VFTHDLIKDRLKNGLKVAVPVTDITRKKIIPCLLHDWNDLKPGAYGVPEPVYSDVIAVSPGEIDLVITPGSAFDEKCGRYGYGGGYYDRFLADEAPRAFKIGLAFQTQMFPTLPLCSHDQRMDCIITETRKIRCAADKHDLIFLGKR
jgi:5-formyltetrahydrofolate cyclo-ligase